MGGGEGWGGDAAVLSPLGENEDAVTVESLPPSKHTHTQCGRL